ncbi:MAG: signal peptidase I [Actinomycetota bacterium]|nr:signal peptidase I [Actinomycetota bacterium]
MIDNALLEEDPPAPDKSRARNLLEWVVIVVGALVVALVVKAFLLQAFYIPSLSMSPTLDIRDRVLVNKLSYDLHEVNRGDVVVFKSPRTNDGSEIKDLIKRVVGLAGETIETRDGRVVVDGVELEESYLEPGIAPGPPVERQVIPEGHVFVMGDNRANSKDSRSFGPIPESLVVGRAFVKVWPVTDLGLL